MTGAEAAGAGGMGVREIMAAIPHRSPFLFVDRVVALAPGVAIDGYKYVTRSEVDRQLRSPLVVIEAVAQVAVILAAQSIERDDASHLFLFAGIEEAHVHGVPAPGDKLRLQARVRRIRRGIGWFEGTASVDGALLVEVSMQAAMRRELG